jgi:hypothetical protein
LLDDISIRYQQKTDVLELLGKPNLNERQIQEEYINAKRSDYRISLLCLSTENEDLYLILKYFDQDESWANYYRLIETIETFAKDKKITLNIDESERKKFTNTANNYSLSNIDSRHGLKKIVKENKTPSMTIEEAYYFARRIAMSYISQVYGLALVS